jgi:beta-glucanase (GH16 family)
MRFPTTITAAIVVLAAVILAAVIYLVLRRKGLVEPFAWVPTLRVLQWGEQCGGRGGACGKYGGQCADSPFSGFTCPPKAFCSRRNEWHWQCDGYKPAPIPMPTPSGGGGTTGSSKVFNPPAELRGRTLALVWSDYFNTGSIDTNKWDFHLGDGFDWTGQKGWGNNEQQCYTTDRENIRIENNMLRITAKYGGNCVNVKGGVRPVGDARITSGKLCSKRSFMHGKYPILVSARIKIPMAKGSFPAFWLIPMRQWGSGTGDHGSWCRSGEIDILEHINAEPWIQTTLIWGENEQRCQRHWQQKHGLNLNDWHTYSCLWTPTTCTVFVDGQRTYYNGATDWRFNNPMNIVLNLAIGGGWAGNEGGFTLPCSMFVDYVVVHEVR